MNKIIKAGICAILVLLMLISMSACSSESKNQLERDLNSTIESMLGKSDNEEADISRLNSLINKSDRLLTDTEAGDKICELVEYSIDKIEIKDEKGTADITVKAPDAYKMICQIAETQKTDDKELLLKELLNKLNGDYETIEKTVTCNFEYNGKKWNLMPNKELFNVLSGNLYDYCANLCKNTIEELAGGENNEK